MAWKRGNPGCPCCVTPDNCGCWSGYGNSPTLVIEFNIAQESVDHYSCLEGGNVYCRPKVAVYGVDIQGTLSVPLKRICNVPFPYLVPDVEETYRPFEGISEEWQETSGLTTCRSMLFQGYIPFYVEVVKDSHVQISAFGINKQVFPALVCQTSDTRTLLDSATSYTPANPTQPGACDLPVTSIDFLGGWEWEVVPGV